MGWRIFSASILVSTDLLVVSFIHPLSPHLWKIWKEQKWVWFPRGRNSGSQLTKGEIAQNWTIVHIIQNWMTGIIQNWMIIVCFLFYIETNEPKSSKFEWSLLITKQSSKYGWLQMVKNHPFLESEIPLVKQSNGSYLFWSMNMVFSSSLATI